MKALILGSIFYLSIASAFGAGYYEQRVAPCDEASMRQAMDAATARTRAGITVVKCGAAPTAPAPRQVQYVQPVAYVAYVDYSGPLCYECGVRY